MLARLFFVAAPSVLFGILGLLIAPPIGFVLFALFAGVGVIATKPRPERGESYQPQKGEGQK